jgi:lipopolysaccharide transport system ATP-binding protein
MSETIIRARDLRKVYRLYSGPGARFLDMFGMLGDRPGAFTEHAALDGVSLDIARGEKVAFIGRNGAGKSTLLKLMTSVVEPTSGTLEVRGKVHALLQIGTGFHPDFTGRENVLAYLAQLGVTGRDAERKYAEIVDFAELEEYIGQPVKTYSSGMAVRLMFSTATAITPELLVLDEVLGVGDAYFAQKSYQRMREMAEGEGTTLRSVTG